MIPKEKLYELKIPYRKIKNYSSETNQKSCCMKIHKCHQKIINAVRTESQGMSESMRGI